MSDFERRREKNKEARELVKIRYIFGVGLVATVWFAYIGSLILKID